METRLMQSSDWEAVRQIYLLGIATGNATFQTGAPEWEAWDRQHLPSLRFVAVKDNVVLGWIALSAVSAREVYRGVAEVSVYVSPEQRGNGVGKLLLDRVIQESTRYGIWTLQAGIFPENEASLALHSRLGFRTVGRREKLGKLAGVWRDVLLLEWRSRAAEFLS